MARTVTNRGRWGDKWIIRGDFNDIRYPEEKKGGRVISEASYKGFVKFIENMNMEEIQGRKQTWANNWHEEGYIETRLYRFFGEA